jgi:putative NIF3 family GTP cyclohydrolase 1 type 2
MRVSVNWSDGQRYGSAKVSESVDPQVILLDVTQQAIDKAVDATRQALDTAEEALGR